MNPWSALLIEGMLAQGKGGGNEGGEGEASKATQRMQELALTIYSADRTRATRAGELEAFHGLGYADRFAASLAIELGATLLTADVEFQKVGKKLKVEFLPRHESGYRRQ